MIVTDRLALRPIRVGVEIAAMLQKLYAQSTSSNHRAVVGFREGIPASRRRRARHRGQQLGAGEAPWG